MSGAATIDPRRAPLFAVVLLLSFVLLVLSAVAPRISLDAFWHLRTGQDWILNGLSPWVDHYSFTFLGESIAAPPYPFQVLLFALVHAFGLDGGLIAYKFGCSTFLLLMVLWWLRDIRASTATACLTVAMVVLLVQFRTVARPELVSFGLAVLMLILTRRAGFGFRWSGLWPIAALLLVWSNYHSAVFGYIIAFGYFVDGAVHFVRGRAPPAAWLRWASWGVVMVAVGFLNPGFYHPILVLLSYEPEWNALILEYVVPVVYAKVPALYLLVLIAAATLALLVRQRRMGALIVWGVLTYNALLTARLVAPAGIVVVCMFALVLSDGELRQRWRAGRAWLRTAGLATAALSVVVALGSAAQMVHVFHTQRPQAAEYYPIDVADYMLAHGLAGRIFNHYETGGYLIYRLAPDSSVYIDGRSAILYPVSHFLRHQRLSQSPEQLRGEIEQLDIQFVVFPTNTQNHFVANATEKLTLDFVGLKYSLFRAGAGNFPLLARLEMHPACWRAGMRTALVREAQHARALLPAGSPLLPFADLLARYAGHGDPRQFLAEVQPSSKWSDAMRRFAGYRALQHGLWQPAAALFRQLGTRELTDLPATSVALLRAGAVPEATRIAQQAAQTTWPSLRANEVQIMLAWMRELAANGAQVEPAFVHDLEQKLLRAGLQERAPQLDAEAFCTREQAEAG